VLHIQKILKRWHVVPLCGDLHPHVLKDSPSFRSVLEFFLPTPKIGIQYSLKQTLPQARMSHNEFTAKWKDTLISLKEMLKQDKKGNKDEPVVTIQFLNDWKGGHPPINNLVLVGKKDPQPRPLPDRCVPPSHTQLEIFWSILWGFINLRGNKDIYSKVFSKYGKEIKIFEEIFNTSFFFTGIWWIILE
jgi:hypothetical protein